MLGDDREFDLERKLRMGWERDARFLEEARVNELDVRLRLRLGVARMAKGDTEEAQVSLCCCLHSPGRRANRFVVLWQRHFAIVLQEDVAEFPELFGAIGDSYYHRKMYDDALDVFQIMAECEDVSRLCFFFFFFLLGSILNLLPRFADQRSLRVGQDRIMPPRDGRC